MTVTAIILAAGAGQRFGGNKMEVLLAGIPVWRRSFDAFLSHPLVDQAGLVVSADALERMRTDAPEASFVVAGGATRQESARAGVAAAAAGLVLVHDGARPFVSADVITRVIAAAKESGAAYPAVPVTDTIRRVDAEADTTLDRDGLYSVQTPQAADREDLLRAYAASSAGTTDDIGALMQIGIRADRVNGDRNNVKLTNADDLARIPMETRTGLGYDIHSFSADPDRKMMLGGVEFDDRPGLDGHSDADALIHAVVDALLGAVNLGDIGLHYPNTDPRWKDQPSVTFLKETAVRLKELGWEIVNIDSTVVAERPKVLPKRDEVCRTMAAAAGISPERVSLKATTNERLGAIGRSEGIAAFAVATVKRHDT